MNWEYKVVTFDFDHDRSGFIEALNALGNQGWEAVNFIIDVLCNGNNKEIKEVAFFKRPKQTEADNRSGQTPTGSNFPEHWKDALAFAQDVAKAYPYEIGADEFFNLVISLIDRQQL